MEGFTKALNYGFLAIFTLLTISSALNYLSKDSEPKSRVRYHGSMQPKWFGHSEKEISMWKSDSTKLANRIHNKNFMLKLSHVGEGGYNQYRKAFNRYFEDMPNIGFYDLMSIIYFESAFKLDARNVKSSATGIIQFMPFVADKLNTSVDEISTMGVDAQMRLTREYILMNMKSTPLEEIQGVVDLYCLVISPANFKKAVYYKGGSKGYEDNPTWDYNKDYQVDSTDVRIILSEGKLTPFKL